MARAKGLARISAYTRAEDHLREKTVHGGIVTIIGILVAVVLFAGEAHRCLSYHMVQTMKVDTTRDELLHIHFNITFPALPCSSLTMDTGDVSGTYHSELGVAVARNGELHKWRLDAEGRRSDREEYHPPRINAHESAFAMSFNLGSANLENMRKAMLAHEGCLIHGWVAVQKVAGNLHFSVRPEALFMSMNEAEIIGALLTRHMHLNVEHTPDASALNASHVIHTLRFGEKGYPGQAYPLEGVRRIDRKATGIDKYFVKVVPTRYRRGAWRGDVRTHQYSVTEYYAPVDTKASNLLPGIFFLYDTSPIAMDVEFRRPGLLHLLVRAAAVVGGTFALTGFWDRVVHMLVLRFGPPQGGPGPSPVTRQRV
ncbi:hypothetical protein ACKKBG_A04210 [Auxenochlorella protothecoides x Auxenochlorella symbiontica]|uniref:Putative endoplasmic reticulum-Golgi intermediate compartment protein 3 n=1 Tax=Auxenochlorella protothecoides TaxID=3075 RepID=A0A087SJD1_AUXPR|nr:putative endoplasmic reticulum-Golgi intermediate compartment protein 3 [Auxenochlorella protothecoides]KFM25835.1 putative endoplasmic reticulum-Golgi intermediate compartment protein 3 [Auxenochlorella protothecoides]RMZ55887.1 hypothetical protein APUTEX25_003853 [Auxenochlorella protothecoides]|eukprot:RMZ55887.1 hypothetical protein APUTEX25_003853 [Auxenochlorella protothecoides]